MSKELEYREIIHDGIRVIVRSDGKEVIVPERKSKDGRTLKRRVAKQSKQNKGYLWVCIGGKMVFVHRLVGKAFCHNENPEENNHIDHIDHRKDHNHYKNLRWVSNRQNHRSYQKKPDGCISRFRGVVWNRKAKKWVSRIYTDEKQVSIGYFNRELDAAFSYNQMAMKLGYNPEALNKLPYNFVPEETIDSLKDKKSSKFRGVSFDKKSSKWRVRIRFKNKQQYLGLYADEVDAAHAYNVAALKYGFNKEALNTLPDGFTPKETSEDVLRVNYSKYKGVTFVEPTNKWMAYINFNKKRKYLGYYSTEEEAARSYNNFVIENDLNRKLNIIEEEIQDSEFNVKYEYSEVLKHLKNLPENRKEEGE